MKRRQFCLATCAGLVALKTGCGGDPSTAPDDLAGTDLAGVDQAGAPACTGVAGGAATAIPVGGARFISSASLYVCRDANGIFALTSVCTHQGCDVDFLSAGAGFQCPCHGAGFTFDGAVTQGPATRPLVNYRVCVDAAGDVSVDTGTKVPAKTRTPV